MIYKILQFAIYKLNGNIAKLFVTKFANNY
jgi:hypothetical protein